MSFDHDNPDAVHLELSSPSREEREQADRSIRLIVSDSEYESIGREMCQQTLAQFTPAQYAEIGRRVLVTVGGWYLFLVDRARFRGTEDAKADRRDSDTAMPDADAPALAPDTTYSIN